MPSPISVLIVTPAPDDRESTRWLVEDLLPEMRDRPDVEVALWYLRGPRWWVEAEPDPTADLVVDDLRTWLPARALDLVGLRRVGDGLRGLRLRGHLRRIHPQVVVLDDGLGARVLEHLGAHVLVVRSNREPAVDIHLEPPPAVRADVWIGAEGAPAGSVVLPPAPVRYYAAERALGDPGLQARLRTSVGLGPEQFVVVGWGGLGWVDGAGMFVRALWALEHRHGIAATGLWVATEGSPDEAARLEAEAERCGVGDRFRIEHGAAELRSCGDVAFLPFRDAAPDDWPLTALLSGLGVVAFAAVAATDPGIAVVADLDVDAAADAIAAEHGRTRESRRAAAYERLDIGPWLDRFLAEVRPLIPS
jgi:hypothetical protein